MYSLPPVLPIPDDCPGRLLIAQGGVDALKIGVTIALRYSCQRPQFGDKVIMNYLTHQDRLLPILANAYALHLAMGSLKVSFVELVRWSQALGGLGMLLGTLTKPLSQVKAVACTSQ
jgi:alkylation response protein AidB-like acyl-CoA dehydrogenase